VHDSGVTVWDGVFQPQTGSALHSLDQLIATEPPLRRLRAALSPKMGLLRAAMAYLERRQMERARTVVAVSPLVRDLLAARHPQQAGTIRTVINGVDLAGFDPTALTALRPAAREALALGDEPAFLLAAHNFRLKGLDTALEALAVLRRQGASARLLVSGAPATEPWLAAVRRLDLDGALTFLGHVEDIRPLYAAADALVHPTRWDACSLVVLEALASGLPIVTTRVNGAAAAIADGREGYLLERPGDAEALAAALTALLDPARRRVMAVSARQAVLSLSLAENYRAIERILVA
jgi:UDP-glucose:(heptosyl)LPS alpha-1,3-glucosyltransferase